MRSCYTKSVSCVDCGKDFTYDYNLHTQCVSEDQKYGGLDYQPKANSNKGQQKQEEWIQKVKKAIIESTATKHIKDLMQRLIAYDNIPRKRQKFINFVRNSLRITNDYYGQQMWEIFEMSIKCEQNDKQNQNNETEGSMNGNKRSSNDSESVASKRLRQSDDNNGYNIENQSLQQNAFESQEVQENGLEDTNIECKLNMNKIIVEILHNSQNNELTLKKLKKKVLKKYKSNDDNCDKQKVIDRFERKVSKNKKVVINEGIVNLEALQFLEADTIRVDTTCDHHFQ
ncbi:unnamed protein product [Oppiella nova]|uniref:Zinc finger C2H2 LYAR-type domain-containing protein n=1 Tax=Oppiella nova TaxID=334625 RepID=A0A7R9LM77_9ACAR|nr:unnamed protein product [Oppiella nova]CAG2164933.1 unnamed protein product [Oppiella nova]